MTNETYGFPLADVVSDRPDRVIIQPKQSIRDEREHGVRTGTGNVLRPDHRLDVRLRLRRQIEAQQRNRSRLHPACEEPHLVPFPTVTRALRPMYRNVGVPLADAVVMVGDVWHERPLRLELVVRLLDCEAGPVRWVLMSDILTVS